MKELKMHMERIEGKEKEKVFESTDKESIISWTITALFDGAVKRCNIKIDQYYEESIEYCRIKATYKRYTPDNTEVKEVYIIENWRNDWGNFINVYKTFKDNKIEVIK